ncbi:hypothetical protein SERLA73DRAFT_38126, partial [Serpula lacrymans var. lacrymans S7.3]
IFINDCLSQEELNLICGVYNTYTGQGPQVSFSSWWPRHSAYLSSGLNIGFWSSAAKQWFYTHLEYIGSDGADLRNGKQWKN